MIDYMEIRNNINEILSKKTNWGRVDLMKEIDIMLMKLMSEKLKSIDVSNNKISAKSSVSNQDLVENEDDLNFVYYVENYY